MPPRASKSRSVLCALLISLAFAGAAQAQGFQYGTISWQQDPNFVSGTQKRFFVTLTAAHRWSQQGSPGPGTLVTNLPAIQYVGANGSSGNLGGGLIVDSINAASDFFVGTRTFQATFNNAEFPVTLSYASCCRLPELLDGNSFISYQLQTVIDPTKGTRSPTSSVTPRIYATRGVPLQFVFPSTAYDGFNNRVTLQATGLSLLVTAAPPFNQANPPGSFSLQSTGLISWTPQTAGLYGVQFLVTSYDAQGIAKNSTPVEVVFEVLEPCPTCPAVTVNAPAQKIVPFGTDAAVLVSVTTTVDGNQPEISHTPLPPGAHFTRLTTASTSTWELSWTPRPDQGPQVVCFQGFDPVAGLTSLGSACTTLILQGAQMMALTGVVRTFSSSHPDMNRPTNDSTGMNFVTTIDANGKPVLFPPAAPNVSQFNQWFNDVAGVNQARVHSLYPSNAFQAPNVYGFQSRYWEPVDGQKFFTYEAHGSFVYQPGLVLTMKSAGDMWVFINGQQPPGWNLHGVHGEKSFAINLDAIGTMFPGQSYPIDIFYAHRGAATIPLISLQLLPEPPNPNAPQVVTIPNAGFTVGNTNRFGSAKVTAGDLQLVSGVDVNAAGAGWLPGSDFRLTNGFDLEFSFQASPTSSGEGFAAVVAASPAVGAPGSGLGYSNIASSLAVEFDARPTAAPVTDPGHQHISMHTLGTAANSANQSASTGYGTQPFDPLLPNTFYNATAQRVRISYRPVASQPLGWMRVWMNDNLLPALEAMVDQATLFSLLNGNGRGAVGLTAGSGAAASTVAIKSLKLTTYPENRPPTVAAAFPSVLVSEDAAAVFLPLAGHFTDPDGTPLTYSVTSNALVNAAIVGDNVRLQFAANQSGDALIFVKATDPGGLFAEALIPVLVSPVNDPPVLDLIFMPVSVNEDAADVLVPLAGHFSDVDGTFTLTASSNSPLVTVTVEGETARLHFAENQSGAAHVTVRATDSNGLYAEAAIPVTVVPVNDAPALAAPFAPVSVGEDAADMLLPLAGHFTDIDDAMLSYAAISDSSVVTATIEGGSVRLHFAPDQSGGAQITVRASDAGALSAETTFAVTVAPVNDGPRLDAPFAPVAAAEDAGDMLIPLAGHFSDVDSALLTFTAGSDAAVVSASIDGDHVRLHFAANQSGAAVIAVRATDADGLFVENAFTATVSPVNDPPVLDTAFDDQPAAEDAADIQVPLAGHFSDIETSPLAYTVTSSNPFVTAAIDGGHVRLHLAPNGSGIAQITVRATDADGAFVDDTFTLSVSAVNDLPQLDTAFVDQSAAEDAADVLVPLAGHFSDVETAAPAVSVTSSQAFVTATLDGGSVRLHFAPNAFGSTQITVRATDADGGFVEDTFAVTVAPVNDPPTLDPIAPATIPSGQAAAIPLSNVTPGPANESGQALIVEAQSSDTAATGPIGYANGALTLSPPVSAVTTTVTITVTVRDAADPASAVTRSFALTITAGNAPPGIEGRMHGQLEIEAGGLAYDAHFRIAERQLGDERGSLTLKVTTPKSGKKKGSVDKFASTRIDDIVFSDDPAFRSGKSKKAPAADSADFTGIGTWNGAAGYRFVAKATDQGEPGRGRDRFQVVVYGPADEVVATVDAVIGSGNIQSDRLKPEHWR